MSYLDVYFSRLNHLGETTAERIQGGGIRSFEKWMAESPHTIKNLSVERGLYFSGIILTNKDKEHEKIMFLNVANDIPLLVGDIMNWTVADGSVEKWILVQEEKKVNGTYRTFWIVRCNYLLKWIDGQGHIQSSWSYFVSSLDSKIKGNFRTWNSLITPQPNKYAEILMPKRTIDRATNFIIEEESWTVVEYDHSSVPGIIYLSLTEGKLNSIYDDLENQIADTDKLAQYSILAPDETQTYVVGDIIAPQFTLMKNGIPTDLEYELISTDKKVAKTINGVLTAVGEGSAVIRIQLKDYPDIFVNLIISVDNAGDQVFSAYIEGPSTIRLNREARYILKSTSSLSESPTFTINNKLVNIVSVSNNECIIHANAKNELGNVILTATYQGMEYSKEIFVVPLW